MQIDYRGIILIHFFLLIHTSGGCSRYESLQEGNTERPDSGANGYYDGISGTDGGEYPESDSTDRYYEEEDACSYSSGGMLQWAIRAGSPEYDSVHGLAVDLDGSFVSVRRTPQADPQRLPRMTLL